jgi:hypothetical protein
LYLATDIQRLNQDCGTTVQDRLRARQLAAKSGHPGATNPTAQVNWSGLLDARLARAADGSLVVEATEFGAGLALYAPLVPVAKTGNKWHLYQTTPE